MERFIESLGNVLSSFWGWLILIGCQLFMIEGVQAGSIGLLVVFLVDFATGLFVSHKFWKAKPLAERPPYFIESGKIRRSMLKGITYLMFVAMSWLMWYLFFDGTTNLPMSSKEFNIISLAFGICIAIECWSVLENMKRLGYDILGGVGRAFKGFWKGYRDVNGES